MLNPTAAAGLWSGLLQWSKVGINALVFVLLARWLTLAEIGAVAASQATFVFVQSLQSAVVPDLMVQEHEERDEHRSTLFLASVGAGAIVSVLVLATVMIFPAVGLHTTTGQYLAALSPLPIILGAGTFYEGLLRRRLAMRSLAVRTMLASSAAGTVAVVLAANGFGGWAMVGLSLVSAASSTVLAVIASHWLPKLHWDQAYLQSIRPQAVALLARHALSSAVIPLLSILVNVQLGAAAAGTMQIAFRILGLIDSIVVSPLRYITMPLFARTARDGRDLGATIVAALSIGSLLLFPSYVGVIATAPALLPVLLGSVTGDAVVTAVQLLLPYGMIALVTWTINNALVATGRAVSVAQRNYVIYPFVVVPSALATFHSVPITMLIYGIWGGLVTSSLAVVMARKYFGIPPSRLLSPLVGPLICAGAMGAIVWISRSTILAADTFVSLVLQIVLGCVVYAALLLLVSRKQLTTAVGLVRGRAHRKDSDQTGINPGLPAPLIAPEMSQLDITGPETLAEPALADGPNVSILYVYGSLLPNTFANSGAVLGLCRALTLNATAAAIVFPGTAEDVQVIRKAYDVPPELELSPIRPSPGPAFYPSIALAAVRTRKDAIIITRAPQIAVMAALMGRRTILELHQHLHTFSNWSTWRKLLRFVPAGRLSVAALTPSVAAGLDSRLAKKVVEVAIIPSGSPDLDRDARTPSHDVGYVGSFKRGKGVEVLERLALQRSSIRFLVVGDPTGDPETASRLSSLPNVELAGFVPPAELAAQMGRFRVGIAPYAAEGFGGRGRDALISSDSMSSLKIAEYMSASCAIVSSAIPSVEAMVTNEVEALLCPPNDDEAWLAALDRLVEDHSLRRRLAAAGRRRFLSTFSMPARAKRFRTLAQGLVAARPA